MFDSRLFILAMGLLVLLRIIAYLEKNKKI